MQDTGVYQIVCTENGKRYFGSSKDVAQALSKHREELIEKSHTCPDLQNDWNKYGEDAFCFFVYHYTDVLDDAIALEQQMLRFFVNKNQAHVLYVDSANEDE